MPEIKLSLPAALGLFTIFLIVGAAVVYIILNKTGKQSALTQSQPTVTITVTPSITLSPTITQTATPVPSFTPLPPITYTVKSSDSCSGIAALFNVSINSIVLLNNLSSSCTLSIGEKLQIPQPTPTASPYPTATLNSDQATNAACTKVTYTVTSSDTLSSIAANYNVSEEAIQSYNGLTGNIVYEGQSLTIPLCMRNTAVGPTPTATQPPAYAAPNLLLPVDGAAFTVSDDEVNLQWASVGTLRSNEFYKVVVTDVTDSTGKQLIAYVTDTRYTVPSSFRPSETKSHIMRWTVTTVRQTGSDSSGNPIYISAGATSTGRDFSWSGSPSAPGSTATPVSAATQTLTPTP